MPNPQDPDTGQRQPDADGPGGPVPADNQPGHHPDVEQDKPNLDAFAERLGVVESSDSPVEGDAGAPRSGGAVPRIAYALLALTGLVGLVLAIRRLRRRSS